MCTARRALERIKPRLGRPAPQTALRMGIGVIAVAAGLYLPPVYAALGEAVVTWVFNTIQVGAALILVSLVISVWWSAEPGEPLKAIAGCLAIALILWASGQAVYGFYQVARGPDFAGPTLADALWLAGYIPLIYGLHLRLRTFAVSMKTALGAAVIGGHLILVALVVVFVVTPILAHPDPNQPLATAINLLYIVFDLAVVLTASLIMQSLARGAMSTPWALIAAGCLMFCSSDILFAYGVWSGSFASDSAGPAPILLAYNILFLSAYVTAAVGTYWLARLHGVI